MIQTDGTLACGECGRVASDEETAGWRAYFTDDEPPEVVSFCPECAKREFGSS